MCRSARDDDNDYGTDDNNYGTDDYDSRSDDYHRSADDDHGAGGDYDDDNIYDRCSDHNSRADHDDCAAHDSDLWRLGTHTAKDWSHFDWQSRVDGLRIRDVWGCANR